MMVSLFAVPVKYLMLQPCNLAPTPHPPHWRSALPASAGVHHDGGVDHGTWRWSHEHEHEHQHQHQHQRTAVSGFEEQGKTVVLVAHGSAVLGALALADMFKPDTERMLAVLRNQGIRVCMLTGDNKAAAICHCAARGDRPRVCQGPPLPQGRQHP